MQVYEFVSQNSGKVNKKTGDTELLLYKAEHKSCPISCEPTRWGAHLLQQPRPPRHNFPWSVPLSPSFREHISTHPTQVGSLLSVP